MARGEILAHTVIAAGHNIALAPETLTRSVLDEAGLSMADLGLVISTGYGRRGVAFAHKTVSEVICHAKGVNFVIPGARTAINTTGQNSKVIGIHEDGTVSNFVKGL